MKKWLGCFLVVLISQNVFAKGPVHKLRNTYYYVAMEADYPNGSQSYALKDIAGQTLAWVTRGFYNAIRIEGSGKLLDGRMLNYAGFVGKTVRYHETIHPWGRGAGNCELVPFRSIAVDRRVIALGSTVEIEETKGMLLPDGTVHDGRWNAIDVGGAIKRDRVDLFIGKRSWNTTLDDHRIRHLQALTVKVIETPPQQNNCVDETPESLSN